MLKWEPAAERGLWALNDPRLSNPSQDEKELLLWSEELGSICSCQSPSPAQISHTTNINPFENKVCEIYFYKEVCSFVHWSRHYVWLCNANICICIMYMYVAIQLLLCNLNYHYFALSSLLDFELHGYRR